MEKFKIQKIKGNEKEYLDDFLVEEVPLTIVSGNQELSTFLCTPQDLEYLVRGFLFTSGFISTPDDIKKIDIDRKRWTAYVELSEKIILKEMVFKRLYTSGCGRGTLYYNAFDLLKRAKNTSDLRVKATWITTLMKDFQNRSLLFLKTGGSHAAAIADKKKLLIFKEDIGRHNAIDKIIGYALKDELPLEDKIIITSGRISSEVLLKAQKCKFPVIISRGAPTNYAVKLAKDMNLTLVGFVRGKSMNIYSVPGRIKTDA